MDKPIKIPDNKVVQRKTKLGIIRKMVREFFSKRSGQNNINIIIKRDSIYSSYIIEPHFRPKPQLVKIELTYR